MARKRHWGGASRCDLARIWLSSTVRVNHPAVACGRGFPSLSKEGSLVSSFATVAYARGLRRHLVAPGNFVASSTVSLIQSQL